MKFCPICNIEYEDKFAFCNKCGCKLQEKIEQSFCPYCGKKVETDGEFCPYCGNSLSDTPSVKTTSDGSPSRNITAKPVVIHRQETVLPEVKIKKNYVKMAPLHVDENEFIDNGFFGFSGRMEKNAFIKKMCAVEILLLASCYFSLLKYWRRLVLGNIIWMVALLVLSTVLILGMSKRRQNDTSLTEGFYYKSVAGIFIVQVIAKLSNLKMTEGLCDLFLLVSIAFAGVFLGSLFFTEKQEVSTGGSSNIKSEDNIDLKIVIGFNLFLLLPIFYFFYKNIITLPYNI